MIDWFKGKVAYLGTWLGLKVGCFAIRKFPRRWFYRVSDTLARVGFFIFRGFRKRSVDNITAALGTQLNKPAIEDMARRSLRNFFRAFVEIVVTVESSDGQLTAEIPVEGRMHIEAALAKGNGVIALSAHLGNFFLVGCRLALEGYSTFMLVNQPRDGLFAQLLDDYRLRVRQKTIHARPRREALQELSEVLRRNEIAVIIADEYRQGRGVHAPLFGKTVLARRGPVTLALRTGAAVVPVYMIRQTDDTLKLMIEPELELDRSDKGKAGIRENTLRMTQWLERTVRTYPDQWNWMNIRWWETGSDTLAAKEPQTQRVAH